MLLACVPSQRDLILSYLHTFLPKSTHDRGRRPLTGQPIIMGISESAAVTGVKNFFVSNINPPRYVGKQRFSFEVKVISKSSCKCWDFYHKSDSGTSTDWIIAFRVTNTIMHFCPIESVKVILAKFVSKSGITRVWSLCKAFIFMVIHRTTAQTVWKVLEY